MRVFEQPSVKNQQPTVSNLRVSLACPPFPMKILSSCPISPKGIDVNDGKGSIAFL
jgi:hypothetical protein